MDENLALELTALEKLLYSVLWKNGDLGKEVHIVEGVLSTCEGNDDARTAGIVFYQYGRHLADRKEPIVDQHTILAFMLFQNLKSDDDSITKIRKKDKVEMEDLVSYKKWMKSQRKSDIENQFHIDKVLFSLGGALNCQRKNEVR